MSSCFNLRLPHSTNKAWKSFTSKLRTKLHKLHKIKKKPKHLISSTNYPVLISAASSTVTTCSSLSKDRKARRRGLLGRSRQPGLVFKRKSSRRPRIYSKSCCTAAPVLVDKLFMDPPVFDHAHIITTSTSTTDDGLISSDDMWESLGFESPLMRGIDERAEQFISTFRAEMQVQERIIPRHPTL